MYFLREDDMDEIVERISTQKIYRAAKGVRDEGTKGGGKRDVGRGRGEGGRGGGGGERREEGEESEKERGRTRENEGERGRTRARGRDRANQLPLKQDILLGRRAIHCCHTFDAKRAKNLQVDGVHALWHRASEKKGIIRPSLENAYPIACICNLKTAPQLLAGLSKDHPRHLQLCMSAYTGYTD